MSSSTRSSRRSSARGHPRREMIPVISQTIVSDIRYSDCGTSLEVSLQFGQGRIFISSAQVTVCLDGSPIPGCVVTLSGYDGTEVPYMAAFRAVDDWWTRK